MGGKDIVRLAAVGDLHCKKSSAGDFKGLFSQIAEHADILALCGDLTDYGLPEEAQILVKDLAVLKNIPIVAVLGNHDYESGKESEVKQILTEAGVNVLDGEATEILGIGFAGIKGFAGGFGRWALGPWGESVIKGFVNEAVQEALKLESALARLRTANKIALLHYSPIQATVEGEPPEIFAYLGTSRLEEPLVRHPVTAVFHGHAHSGSFEGTTSSGTPVYNVAMPLFRRKAPDKLPFRVIELSMVAAEPQEGQTAALAQAATAPTPQTVQVDTPHVTASPVGQQTLDANAQPASGEGSNNAARQSKNGDISFSI